jgi:hypothetical protein
MCVWVYFHIHKLGKIDRYFSSHYYIQLTIAHSTGIGKKNDDDDDDDEEEGGKNSYDFNDL